MVYNAFMSLFDTDLPETSSVNLLRMFLGQGEHLINPSVTMLPRKTDRTVVLAAARVVEVLDWARNRVELKGKDLQTCTLATIYFVTN